MPKSQLLTQARVVLGLAICLSLSPGLPAAAQKTAAPGPGKTAEKVLPAPAGVTAAQIIEKHIAARGGPQAWHAVQTLSVSGKLDAGSGDSSMRSSSLSRGGVGVSVRHQHDLVPGAGTEGIERAKAAAARGQVQLPFRLEMKRPARSRLEIDFAGTTAVQVYDGQNGWKLRPYLNRNDVEAFSPEEAKAAAPADLEGPLVDYAAKGTKVDLEGVEKVEGHDAYRLKLTLKGNRTQHVWIDTHSYLDVKIEGSPRHMDGRMHDVWVYQYDFRPVNGVMIPYVYETAVEGYPQVHRMTIESAAVNQALDDSRFTKPQALVARLPAPASQATAPGAVRN